MLKKEGVGGELGLNDIRTRFNECTDKYFLAVIKRVKELKKLTE